MLKAAPLPNQAKAGSEGFSRIRPGLTIELFAHPTINSSSAG